MTKVEWPESTSSHLMVKMTIWIINQRVFVTAWHVRISHYELHSFQCQSPGAITILMLHTHYFRIRGLQLRQWHQHCSTPKVNLSCHSIGVGPCIIRPGKGANQQVSWRTTCSAPNGSSDQNISKDPKATVELAKTFMEATVFTMNPSPILSNDMHWMVEEAWKQAVEYQDHQRALEGVPVDAPSVYQMSGGPTLKINWQTWQAEWPEYCLMLLYQTYGCWLPPQIYIVKTEY